MVENPEESLWIHGNEPEDVFQLQGIFGLHPLSVDAVIHQNQPSKIEEYDEYLFAIVDGVRYDEEEQKQNKNDGDEYSVRLIEDDLYIFFERRWIITINFYNHHFEENIIKKVRNLQQSIAASKQSSSNSSSSSSKDRGVSMEYAKLYTVLQ